MGVIELGLYPANDFTYKESCIEAAGLLALVSGRLFSIRLYRALGLFQRFIWRRISFP